MDALETILDLHYPQMEFEDFKKLAPKKYWKHPDLPILYEIIKEEQCSRKQEIRQIIYEEIKKLKESGKITMEEVLVYLENFDEKLESTVTCLESRCQKQRVDIMENYEKILMHLNEVTKTGL